MNPSQHPEPPAQDPALSEAEVRYYLMFETSPHGIVFQDWDGAILDANPAA